MNLVLRQEWGKLDLLYLPLQFDQTEAHLHTHVHTHHFEILTLVRLPRDYPYVPPFHVSVVNRFVTTAGTSRGTLDR